MATRRGFLKGVCGVVAGALLSPMAKARTTLISSGTRRLYGGVKWLPDGTKVYTAPHYDCIEVLKGERVILSETVKSVGQLIVNGGELVPNPLALPSIGTLTLISGTVGLACSTMSFATC